MNKNCSYKDKKDKSMGKTITVKPLRTKKKGK